jgi:hypothetical protein
MWRMSGARFPRHLQSECPRYSGPIAVSSAANVQLRSVARSLADRHHLAALPFTSGISRKFLAANRQSASGHCGGCDKYRASHRQLSLLSPLDAGRLQLAFSAGSGDFFAASFACPPGTSAPVDPIRPQVHFHELEVDIPVGRHCAVPAGVHRIAECMQNRLSRGGHPVRAEVVFAGKPVHRSSRHRGQEIRPSGRTTYACYRSAEAAAAVRSARPAYGRRPAVDRHAGRTWRTIRALLW